MLISQATTVKNLTAAIVKKEFIYLTSIKLHFFFYMSIAREIHSERKAKPSFYLEIWTQNLLTQYSSLNIQIYFTVMLPDLRERIRPTTHILHLLLNFILDKCSENLWKKNALISVAFMHEDGSSWRIFLQALSFASFFFLNVTKNLNAVNEIINSTR